MVTISWPENIVLCFWENVLWRSFQMLKLVPSRLHIPCCTNHKTTNSTMPNKKTCQQWLKGGNMSFEGMASKGDNPSSQA